MAEQETLAERFEAHREHLRAVAYRMLGSDGEAEDAVQEAWLRLTRAEAGSIGNLGGWLTTVVARVCLDMLRSRKSRRQHEEGALEAIVPEAAAHQELQPDAALRLADSVGLAMLVVLDALAPAERIAFVLHDLFDVPFDDIAPIVGRNPAATRQLASRARRRVQGATAANDDRVERSAASPRGAHGGREWEPSEGSPFEVRIRQQRVVDAFLTAAREGDFDALLAALDPDVVLRADPLAIQTAAARAAQGEPAPALAPEVHGAQAVAEGLRGRARGARPALVGGVPGAVWAPGGVPRAGFAFTFAGSRIASIEIFMDPVRLRDLVEYDAQQS